MPTIAMHFPLLQACPTGPLQGGVVQGSDLGRALRSALEAGLSILGASISSVSLTTGTAQLSTPSSSGPSAQITYSVVSVRKRGGAGLLELV